MASKGRRIAMRGRRGEVCDGPWNRSERADASGGAGQAGSDSSVGLVTAARIAPVSEMVATSRISGGLAARLQVVDPVHANRIDHEPEDDQSLPAEADPTAGRSCHRAEGHGERNRVERVSIAVLEPATAVIEQVR